MPRAPKKCGRPGCETRVVGRVYCPQCTADQQARDNTTARGYGTQHQRARAQWARQVATGTVRCWRCHELIDPALPWDLGHDDNDRGVYRGPEHPRCNRGTKSRERTGAGTLPPPT